MGASSSSSSSSRRRRRRRRERAYLLDVARGHDSLSESSNRALSVLVLTHNHLRRRRHPSRSSVVARVAVLASSSSKLETRRPSSRLARARAHLSLERALECEKVGKSTENERHRACVRARVCRRRLALSRPASARVLLLARRRALLLFYPHTVYTYRETYSLLILTLFTQTERQTDRQTQNPKPRIQNPRPCRRKSRHFRENA